MRDFAWPVRVYYEDTDDEGSLRPKRLPLSLRDELSHAG